MIIKARRRRRRPRHARRTDRRSEIEAAYQRCQSEAQAAFGRGDVYVEEFIPRARHVEVQILGDRAGQHRRISASASAASSAASRRSSRSPRRRRWTTACAQQIIDAAVRFAKSVGYSNLGTFEFLVDVSGRASAQPFVFIEANARLQVEHTVTEEVTGVDLVQTQIRLAQGATLAELGLDEPIAAARLRDPGARQHGNDRPDGSVRPGGGTLTVYEAPSGPGVRTDGFGYAGYRTSSAFDSLLAKVIAHSPSPDFAAAVGRDDAGAERIPARRRRHQHRASCATSWPIRDFVAGTSTRAGSTSTSRSSRSSGEQRQRFVEAANAATSDARLRRRAGQQPRSAGAVRARRRR